MDDLNFLRIAITLLSFAAFITIVVRAWRAANAAPFAEAAALPFADEPRLPAHGEQA